MEGARYALLMRPEDTKRKITGFNGQLQRTRRTTTVERFEAVSQTSQRAKKGAGSSSGGKKAHGELRIMHYMAAHLSFRIGGSISWISSGSPDLRGRKGGNSAYHRALEGLTFRLLYQNIFVFSLLHQHEYPAVINLVPTELFRRYSSI